MRGKFSAIAYTIARKPLVTFELTSYTDAEIEALQKANKPLVITAKPESKKRSVNANAYMWSLCNQISEKMNISSVGVYRRAIREAGVYEDYFDLPPDEARKLAASWGEIGLGWYAERLDYEQDGYNEILRCYKGTSTYTAPEIARVIDYLIEDARALGIDVMNEKERSLLIEQWKGKKNDK